MLTIRHDIQVITPPVGLPIKAADVRSHCNEVPASDVKLINDYIHAAWEQLEHDTSRALLNTQFEMSLDCFPANFIELQRAPLVSVDAIRYDDTTGLEQTWDPAEYRVTGSEPGRIEPAYGKQFPTARHQQDAVRIQFTAGYGATSADVPATAKQAIRLYVAESYRFRELGCFSDAGQRAWDRLVAQLSWRL